MYIIISKILHLKEFDDVSRFERFNPYFLLQSPSNPVPLTPQERPQLCRAQEASRTTVFSHVFGVPDQWIQWFLVDICRYIELVSSVCKPTNTTGKPPSCMVGLVLMLKAFGWMMSSGTSDVRARACPPRMG